MYAVAARRDFSARHFLVGGDWGAENERHSHDYRLEVELRGAGLDEHGYLVDIADVESAIESLMTRFEGSVLNELPEFQGLNPSIEHLCRIFCRMISGRIRAPGVSSISVRIWESDKAWASYSEER